ncbi:hypothetical protein [Agrobacterium rosae]|uniref:Uncharacterized protein n=1 Tax=Agrobacterium rosae TaxID=1972867 RepID=A0AAE5RV12_9HYPH|nr:hypothetical protein [Agrobacterium rosae]KAA3508869.1 hypothetical protein DXM21_23005 [Agrobacterium rosae]KAA3513445.1 hypothetical protein DXM25_23200 [Agrobacterium rosae]MCM2435513.1 hypothetical protein [Agrobacterium rosae]MDX8305004.1 hypothetical protein [Agrobacterium rosae]MDX8312905.1 hypothetical protein [Agrobacterium rosae]
MKSLPQNDHHYNIDPIGLRIGPTAPLAGFRPQRAFSVIADTNDADIGRQQTPHSTKLIGHEPLTTYNVTLEL